VRDSSPAPVVLLLHRDDDRAMYAEFFRHHGFTADCPVDVPEALARAADADVIVTELMVPTVEEGYAFIERLRAEVLTRHKPIIVVTSWAWQTERLRALEAGCDVFLTKPCLPQELLRRVRRVLAAAPLRNVRGKPTKSGARQETRRHKP